MPTESQLHRAFQRAVRDIQGGVRYGALRDSIARNDYLAALDAVDIDDAAFDGLRAMILQTYAEGGINAIDGTRWPVRTRWNSATAESERFAREVVGQHITRIAEDSRQSVRDTVADGLAFGRSTNRIALDIVGRREGNRRVGGVVGLNHQQAKWVTNMRQWLATDPARALTYSRRDRRFDAVIRSAVASGRPLTAAQIDRISAAYSDRLLLLRGQTIARTERQAATNAGRQEAWRQSAERLGLPLEAVKKTWLHSTRKMEPRPFHLEAGRTKLTVQGLNTPFDIGGNLCLYPHDPTLPASEVVNCSCSVRYSINRRWRDGG